ncbi:MAG: hypothetical protein ACREQY_02275 [Candidatus Binatia bacterium]
MSEKEPKEPIQPGDDEGRRLPFYVGTIVRVHYGSGSGVLRTGNGREVRFVLPFVDILDGRRIEDLTDGMEVGFDLGWTSRGLRVTKIKIF